MRTFPSLVLACLLASITWAQEAPRPPLTLDAAAPELSVTTSAGTATSLAALRTANPGKLLVIQFGSITDPLFRQHMPAVEKLAERYADKVLFVIVYQKEAHPADGDALDINVPGGFNIAQPTAMAERQKLAQQATDRLQIARQTVVVDAWNNTSSLRYGSYPNMTFLVDAKGILRAGYPFMDTAKVREALDVLLSGKELPAELRGPMRAAGGPAPFDYAAAAAEMSGGRGPASIAAVLDRVTLTDQQKQNVLVALAEFMANLQEFRQARGGAAQTGRGNATMPDRGAPARGQPAGNPPAAQAALRTSADRLKNVVRQNMKPADATALFAALDAMAPAQRLFVNP